MQRVCGERLAAGFARGAMQGAGAPEVHCDVGEQHQKRDDRQFRHRRAFAQPADRLHHDAARQNVKQRDDAQRRQAFEFAVAVVMFVVGRAIGEPHHHPGNHGRDEVDRRMQRFGDQREAADGDADDEFGGGKAAARDHRDCGNAAFPDGNIIAHAR